MKKQYTTEFKLEVVREVLKEQRSINQIASDYGVHPQQIYRWRDQVLAAMSSAFADHQAQQLAELQTKHQQEVEQLYTQIGRLATELEWVKKKAGRLLER